MWSTYLEHLLQGGERGITGLALHRRQCLREVKLRRRRRPARTTAEQPSATRGGQRGTEGAVEGAAQCGARRGTAGGQRGRQRAREEAGGVQVGWVKERRAIPHESFSRVGVAAAPSERPLCQGAAQ
jgi:hypothetical protein